MRNIRSFVKICNNFNKKPKVLKKYADRHVVDKLKIQGVIIMYSMWPGCYSFREELQLFLLWFKEQADSLILKVYELDRMLST